MKQTEIGLIPDDWKEHTLRDLIDILTDYTANGSFESLARNVRYLEYPSYARLIRLTDIRTNFTNEGVYVSKYSYDFLKKSSLHGGELLLANVGAYAGFSFIYPENLMFRGTLGPNMFLIKFFNQKIDNTFAYYAFSHGAVYNQLISKAASSAQPKLNKEDVRTCYINIPSSIQEQQRIAKALSDVDALISTTEKLIQKKKNIKQGTMQNLLTGKKRLPGFGNKQTDLFVPNGTHTKEVKDVSPEQIRLSAKMKQTELGEIPEDWEVKTLGEISTIIMGQSPNSDCYNTQKGMVLIQGNADISNRKTICRFYTTHITKTARKGDVIFTVRAPVGNVAKATFDCCLGRGVCAIQRISDFLYYYLIFIEDSWSKTSTGSTFDSINSDTLASTLIIQPSSKEEQTAIANVLSSMDKEIETLNTKLEKYRNLKTAMMQQLLTGKIRLV
ncbi:type I restriction enzyme, S subunit [Treponema berlinense]|uniref:Type I restriction enzyme, S subunit n=1 Tax=Treponema berlinense TaxID=225004 RepID=A0A1T4QN44_9SPIR|nr:restriction endonuclease subunit S [Treponema berlinense]SKA05183.1 type I restriction enzyme, S subunit [Treponema berlinense]